MNNEDGQRGAPPILPLYKVSSKNKKKVAYCSQVAMSVLMFIIPIFLLLIFFASIYVGSTYLQNQLQNESDYGIINIGLPNTRNKIRKWSIEHLNGIDITALGPPPISVKKSDNSNRTKVMSVNNDLKSTTLTNPVEETIIELPSH